MVPYNFFKKYPKVTCILVDLHPFDVTIFFDDYGRQPFSVREFNEGQFRDDFMDLIADMQRMMTLSRPLSHAYFPNAEAASRMLMQTEDLLTPEEVSKALRVTAKTIRDMLRAGKLQGIKIGRQWRIKKSVFDKLMSEDSRNV